MRRLLLAVMSVLVLALPALAQKAPITSVISDQIAAFQKDDFETAFTYASPTIRGRFGSPERFGEMVQQGYPMVWRPAEVRYLALREVAGSLWQRVMITDTQGRVHLLDYQMVKPGNDWKINAVQLLTGQGKNA